MSDCPPARLPTLHATVFVGPETAAQPGEEAPAMNCALELGVVVPTWSVSVVVTTPFVSVGAADVADRDRVEDVGDDAVDRCRDARPCR